MDKVFTNDIGKGSMALDVETETRSYPGHILPFFNDEKPFDQLNLPIPEELADDSFFRDRMNMALPT
jgi:hypothetical protein